MNNSLELKYGVTSTYPFELDKESGEWLSKRVNRSRMQVDFLFQLCGGDFEKLKRLEAQIKNNFIYYCPSNVEEVERILNLTPAKVWFNL